MKRPFVPHMNSQTYCHRAASDGWRFETELFMDTDTDSSAERLCAITISEVTGTSHSDGRHLKYFLGDSSSIRMKRQYHAQMVEVIHRGVLPLQFARVRALSEEDRAPLSKFIHYLHAERRVSSMPVLIYFSQGFPGGYRGLSSITWRLGTSLPPNFPDHSRCRSAPTSASNCIQITVHR